MKNNKLLIILFLFLIAGFTVSGQSYSIDYLTQGGDFDDYCGQTTTNYVSDRFDIEVNQIGNSPNGYTLETSGSATVDGYTCIADDFDVVYKTSVQSLCDIFDERLQGCCEGYEATFIIIPNYSILTPAPSAANALPEVTLEMTAGYDPLVYQWEFLHPTTNNWTSFPDEFLGQSSITFNAEDLFGANASSFYEVSIQYRIALCNGWVPPGFPYTYSFIRESPNVEDVVVIDPTCQYNEDGEFTLTFDRPLDSIASEELTSLSLEYLDSGISYQFIPTASYDSNQFTWPLNVKAGSYMLEYQSGGANSFKIFGPIVIGSPPSLEYQIQATDISCFNEDDGTITITIDPNSSGSLGTPPYKYTINGGAPVNFTGTTTSIQNLGPNSYNIQVFDQNDCTQRL